MIGLAAAFAIAVVLGVFGHLGVEWATSDRSGQ